MTEKTKHGKIAAIGGYILPIQVLCSGAGWYIGCATPELGPVSRESEEYWATLDEGTSALELGTWTQRYHP